MELVKLILQIGQNVAAFLMIALVLLHSPKGDGIGAIGGTAQVFSSVKGANDALVRVTMWVSGTFFLLSFVLGYYLKG